MKKIIIILLLCITILGQIQSVESVNLEKLETITTNRRANFTFLGLNESQSYIVVFTDHSPGIENVTFTSSGFRYSIDVFIANDIDNDIILSLYQYDLTTELNSSSVLFQVTIRLIKTSELNDINYIIDNIVFITPIIIVGLFTLVILKVVRKQMRP